jgi:hypothetical protein
MKSGPAVAGELFDAVIDKEAISFCRQKYTDRYDAQTGTVYLWKGARFVWGQGLEATAIYSDNTSFPQNAGDSGWATFAVLIGCLWGLPYSVPINAQMERSGLRSLAAGLFRFPPVSKQFQDERRWSRLLRNACPSAVSVSPP